MPIDARETILIVEDDPGIAELEQLQLERAGFHTVAANTAQEALHQMHEHSVALVLLDYRLPDNVDGIDLYGRMRAAGYDPPVILVTGFSDESTAIKALRAGVRDFVSKSVEFLDYLPEAVGRVLKQVRTERKLVESEDRFRTMANSAPVFIWTRDETNACTFCNDSWLQFKGRCLEDELGDGWMVGLHPEDFQTSVQTLRTAHGARQPFALEYRMRRADGAYRWLLDTGSPRFLTDGRFAGYVGSAIDITERKEAEELLQKNEKRYRGIVDTAGAVILTLTPDLRILDWNQEAERVFGWKREEVLGADYARLCLPESQRTLSAGNLWTLLQSRPAKEFERTVRTRGGEERVLLWNFTSLHDDQGVPQEIIAIGIDTTERKSLEAQLRQAQKMEAIGMLAGGVAHDFNNVLTVILGFSDFLLTTPGLPSASHELVREIKKAGDRAASLTRQLLAFSRRLILQPVVLDLNALVIEIDKMLRRLIGEDISLTTSLGPDLKPVLADPGQIEQVVINLAVNARDAMPKGGQLTIETHNVELDLQYAEVNPGVSPGQYVLLAMTDTGHGMDEETLGRIFEPFFTTKGVGKGTGLGLATVYGIVKQSGGHIKVYSEVGVGTSFKVYLPQSNVPHAKPRSASVEIKMSRGDETILLVEDEDIVRSLGCIALQSLGYTILDARDPAIALDIAARHPSKIHLLVTDVVMPQCGGPELAERLCALRPDLKVLYVSGYTDDAIVRHGVLKPGTAFLQKPYTPSILSRKVREVLEGS